MTGPSETAGQYGDGYGGGRQYGAGQYGDPQGGDQYSGGQQGGYQYSGAQYGGYQQHPGGGNQMQGPGSPGGLGVRFGARVIDHLIVGIPYAIIFGIIAAAISSTIGSWIVDLVVSAVFAVIWTGYFVWFETNRGQTLGKQMLHLRVQGPGGQNPTTMESLKRNLYVVIESIGMFLGALIPLIGPFVIQPLSGLAAFVLVIVIAVTISNSPTKQGKHDEMAGGTRVITTN